jgi:hypothetical protein
MGWRPAARPSCLAAAVQLVCAWSSAPLAAQPTASSPGPSAAGAPTAEGEASAPHEAPALHQPTAAAQVEYRAVVARAITEFAAGRWAEARSLFLRGHALWPSARTLRSLGMTAFELRDYPRALVELQAALDDTRRPLSDEQRAQVTSLIEQTRAFVGRYRVRLSPARALLLVDGDARELETDGVLLLGVGRHELVVRSEGHRELQRVLDVHGDEDQELTLTLQPIQLALPPAARPLAVTTAAPDRAPQAPANAADGARVWTWVAGGAALALGAASAVLWFESKAEFDELARKCRRESCARGDLDTSAVELPETAHQVTFGLALGAGVGAVVAFFLEGDGAPSEGLSVGFGTLSARKRF